MFLFQRSDGYLLLDTGIRSEDSLRALQASLASVGANWAAIQEILVSHMHPDHIGAAAELRRRCAAPVRMPPAETAAFLLQHGAPARDVEQMRSAAARAADTYERLEVDGGIEAGERIEFDGGTLEAISAPGHSPAQLCFYCTEQKVLFSTDAILPSVTPNIGLHWFYQGNPLGDYCRTLEALYQLDIVRILPSHGRPFQGHRSWIDKTRTHQRNRCDSIAGMLGREPRHGYAIAGQIWGQERSLLDRRFAMAEALSHLQYMALERRVSSTVVDGVKHWTRP